MVGRLALSSGMAKRIDIRPHHHHGKINAWKAYREGKKRRARHRSELQLYCNDTGLRKSTTTNWLQMIFMTFGFGLCHLLQTESFEINSIRIGAEACNKNGGPLTARHESWSQHLESTFFDRAGFYCRAEETTDTVTMVNMTLMSWTTRNRTIGMTTVVPQGNKRGEILKILRSSLQIWHAKHECLLTIAVMMDRISFEFSALDRVFKNTKNCLQIVEISLCILKVVYVHLLFLL